MRSDNLKSWAWIAALTSAICAFATTACSPSASSIEKSSLKSAKPSANLEPIIINPRPTPNSGFTRVFLYKDKLSMNIIAGQEAESWFSDMSAKKQHITRLVDQADDQRLETQLRAFKNSGTVEIPVSATGDWAEPFEGVAFFELSLANGGVTPQRFATLDYELVPPAVSEVAGATPKQPRVVNWTLRVTTPDSAVRNPFLNNLVAVTLVINTKDSPTAPAASPSPQAQ